MYKIYCLKDPDTFEIRYVGITTRSLNARLSQHIHDSKRRNHTHKTKWISLLIRNNKKPVIELIEKCTENNWEEREKYWINKFKNLTNTLPGGKGIVLNRRIDSINRSAEAKQIPIIQLSKEGEFIKKWESAKKAAENLEIYDSAIGNCLQGRSATCKGFRWVYEKDYFSSYTLKPIRSPNAIPVQEYDLKGNLIKEWKTMYAIYSKLGVKHETFKKYLNKPLKGKIYKIKI